MNKIQLFHLLPAAKLRSIYCDEQTLDSTLFSMLYDTFGDVPVFVHIASTRVQCHRSINLKHALTAGRTALVLARLHLQFRRKNTTLGWVSLCVEFQRPLILCQCQKPTIWMTPCLAAAFVRLISPSGCPSFPRAVAV